MQIKRQSMITGRFHTREINVTEEQLAIWTSGQQLIQNAMPHLSKEDREFLISGSTQEEWDEYMKEPAEAIKELEAKIQKLIAKEYPR